jgi:hypothetical protein
MNPLGVRVGQYQREGDLAASPPPVPSARLIAGAAAPRRSAMMRTSSFLGWTGLRRPWPLSPRRAHSGACRSIFSCWTRDHAHRC